MAESVRWQRFRMIGQAGVIVGLTGSLVVEGFGWDLIKYNRESSSDDVLFKFMGLFGRKSNKLL